MAIIIKDQNSFKTEVLESEIPVLVDFFATWCGPCRMVAPIVEEIAQEHEEYAVCKIDVDEAGGLAQAFGIVSIPTLVVVKNGKVVTHAVGAQPKEKILAMLATAD
jgi:thioredoxin 1